MFTALKIKRFSVSVIAFVSAMALPVFAANHKAHSPNKTAAKAKTADEVFIDIKEAAQKNKVEDVFRLAKQLPQNYPLYAYAEYWKLKMRQPDVSDTAFQGFISDYEGSFIADRLRNDWLLILGKREDWAKFDEQLPQFALQDDPQVDCYAVASKIAQGQHVKDEARRVILKNSQHANGAGCNTLLNVASAKGVFNADDVQDVDWIRSESKRNPNTGRTAAHRAVQSAAACAQKLGNDCMLPFRESVYTSTLIALPENLLGTGSDNALEWAIRGALRVQDWPVVLGLTQRLPQHLKSQATWVYWQARALHALKQPEAAKSLMQTISSGWGFYNILAREALGLGIQIPPALTPNDLEVKKVLQRPEIERMQVFYRTGMRWEGNREWNWMLRGLTDVQLSTYAEAGRRLGHYDRMVNTAERTRVQLDFSQRFPMPFYEHALPIAQQNKLDLNWVYGLIRQESRFITEVRSSVGAQGLMQVMPKTAAWVARKIDYTDFRPERVQEPVMNLTIGQAYLAMVLADLDQMPILATAAYNAGPGRPRAWRASLPFAVEGAIFAETIPFNETRGYVKSVLANATLYGVVTGKSPKTLTQWLGTVAPKVATPTQLP